MEIYDLQPEKNKFKTLAETLKSLFLRYNKYLLKKWDAEITQDRKEDKEVQKKQTQSFDYSIDNRVFEVCNVTCELQKLYKIDWNGDCYAKVIDTKGAELGRFIVTQAYDTLRISGEKLIDMVKKIREKFKFSNDPSDFTTKNFKDPINGGMNYVG